MIMMIDDCESPWKVVFVNEWGFILEEQIVDASHKSPVIEDTLLSFGSSIHGMYHWGKFWGWKGILVPWCWTSNEPKRYNNKGNLKRATGTYNLVAYDRLHKASRRMWSNEQGCTCSSRLWHCSMTAVGLCVWHFEDMLFDLFVYKEAFMNQNI